MLPIEPILHSIQRAFSSEKTPELVVDIPDAKTFKTIVDSRSVPALESSSQPPRLAYPWEVSVLRSPPAEITPINLSTSHPAVELPVTEGRVAPPARLPRIDRAVAAERYNINSGQDVLEVLPQQLPLEMPATIPIELPHVKGEKRRKHSMFCPCM
jgi:hypothetical protein